MEAQDETSLAGAPESAWAARLVKERDRLGLKPEELADIAGVHRTTMFMYLKGARAPDAPVLTRLLAGGIDVLYVLSGRRERRGVEDLGERARDLLDRYNALPSKELQTFVDQALLLASLASNDRLAYHDGALEDPAKISIKRSKVGNVAGRDMQVTTTPGRRKR